jgi:serine phosphatase RsbU (regulator of sigma subunit)
MDIKSKAVLTFLVFFLAGIQTAYSQNDKTDNLTEKLQRTTDPDLLLKYANEELSAAQQRGDKASEAEAHYFKAVALSNMYDYENANHGFKKAIELCDTVKGKRRLGDYYNDYANNLTRVNDYNLASEFYNKALHVFFELNDTLKITDVYRNMGRQCVSFHLYETAGSYYSYAFKLDSAAQNRYALALDFFQTGKSDYNQYLDLDSVDLLLSGLQKINTAKLIALQEDSTKRCLADCAEQLMLMHTSLAASSQGSQRQKFLDTAKFYYAEAENYSKESGVHETMPMLEICNANIKNIEGNPKEAREKLAELEKRFDQDPIKYNRYRAYLYRTMIWVLKSTGNYKEAVEYSEKFKDVEEATYNREFAVKSTKASAEAEYGELIRQREEAEKEQKVLQEAATKRQRMITCFFIVCIVLAGLLAFIIWKGLHKKRKNNELLAKQKAEISQKNNELKLQNQKIMSQRDEIMAQRDEIETQRSQLSEANARITASIRYAQRIQTAAVPSEEMMNKIFGECMIFWRPLNIVSGDFYWATQTGEYKLVTAADCTGHGVPGAFMSMLGVSTLNDIAAQKNIESESITAAGILNELRDKIIAALRQSGPQRETQDGMDMALCIINREKNELQYAGANRPLWFIRNGELTEYKADRMPVGYHIRKTGLFTNHIIKIESGDTVYMSSDGLSDQFGGENGISKFGTKQLKELLVKISTLPFNAQKEVIEQAIDGWRAAQDFQNPAPQLDDQILLGLRF